MNILKYSFYNIHLKQNLENYLNTNQNKKNL